MRQKDWADHIGEELMSLIADEPDESVIQERIVGELRKAFAHGLNEVPIMEVLYVTHYKSSKGKSGSKNLYQFSINVEDREKAEDKKWVADNGRKTWLKKVK